MNDIDFLPQDYICVQTKRSKSNWLRVLFVLVGALIAVGWGAHRQSMWDLIARRNRMREQATLLMAQLHSVDSLKAELVQVENERRLIDALRSTAPPSRWLDAIVAVLPPQTVLSDVRAEIDEGAESTAQSDSELENLQIEGNSVDPVEQDLQRLFQIVPRRSLTISIRGTAADDLEVSRFLNGLHRNDLFERVQLLFTDQQFNGSTSIRSFAIRLRTQSLTNRFAKQTPMNAPAPKVAYSDGSMSPSTNDHSR